VLSHSKIDVRRETTVEEIIGDEGVTGVHVRDVAKGEESQITLKGVFVYVGLEPNTGFLRDIIQLSATGHVPTDVWMRTKLPGLYAVGDIRQDSPAQAITSAGEGAVAAIAAHRYIKESFA
jgi:thioredoxin reductase (NADPH)